MRYIVSSIARSVTTSSSSDPLQQAQKDLKLLFALHRGFVSVPYSGREFRDKSNLVSSSLYKIERACFLLVLRKGETFRSAGQFMHEISKQPLPDEEEE